MGPAERILLTGILKHLPRACWLAVGIKEPESVAEHVFRTAIIADLLAQEEGADPDEEVVLAVLHDLPEAIVGNRHKMARIHTNVNKQAIWRFLGLKEPKMTEIVRDADLLELLATIKEYESVGVKGLERWKKTVLKELRTETAKEWAESILDAPPLGEWYIEFFTKTLAHRNVEIVFPYFGIFCLANQSIPKLSEDLPRWQTTKSWSWTCASFWITSFIPFHARVKGTCPTPSRESTNTRDQCISSLKQGS